MTSIAVTASICASASEAALLVASFMSISLDLGMAHRCAGSAGDGHNFSLGTPHDEYSLFDESPLGEYRLCESQIILRRQFDSPVTESESRFVRRFARNAMEDAIRGVAGRIREAMQVVAPPPAARYCPAERHCIRPPETSQRPKGMNHGPYRLQRSRQSRRPHPRNAGQESQRQYFPDDGAFA